MLHFFFLVKIALHFVNDSHLLENLVIFVLVLKFVSEQNHLLKVGSVDHFKQFFFELPLLFQLLLSVVCVLA